MTVSSIARTSAIFALLAGAASIARAQPQCNASDPYPYCHDDALDLAAPTLARSLVFAPAYHTLAVMNSASSVALVNTQTGTYSVRLSNATFHDQSLSPSGRYLFATDDGPEPMGSTSPLASHFVHRADLASGQWDIRTAPYYGGRVEAVSDDELVLQTIDQWNEFTYNRFGVGSVLQVLNNGTFGPGWYCFCYYGDIQYDKRTGRLLHGQSGSTSNEIHAYQITGTNFANAEQTGTYGSAQDGGGSSVLSTDGSAFYYGRMQVNALNVQQTIRMFPEVIYAANSDLAFGKNAYYDAHTGQIIGALPFATTVYALNPNGGADFWTYDEAANKLRYFTPYLAVFKDGFE